MLSKSRIAAVIQRDTVVLNERVVRSAVTGIDAWRRLRGDAVVAVVQPGDFRNGDDATG